jgi:23S rRNA (guanosine2251-2'-O)-methyltransferase
VAPQRKEDILYGISPVEGALRAGRRRLARLYLKSGRLSPRLAVLRDLAAERGIPMTERDPAEMERLCGSGTHQGAALSCGTLPARGEAECLRLGRQPNALLVALDEVQDPQNFGAVVRACAVFGISGVVLPRHHSAPLSAAASKASAGHLETFPVYTVANLARFLVNCRKQGFWVAGTSEQGGTPLHSYDPARPLMVVMGNEGRGLRPLVARQCDVQLTIHTAARGGLNVAAATAVLLYHLTLPR